MLRVLAPYRRLNTDIHTVQQVHPELYSISYG